MKLQSDSCCRRILLSLLFFFSLIAARQQKLINLFHQKSDSDKINEKSLMVMKSKSKLRRFLFNNFAVRNENKILWLY